MVACPCPGEAARFRREYRIPSAFRNPERAGKIAMTARAIARVLLSANLERQIQVRNYGGRPAPLLPSGHRLWTVRHVQVFRSAAGVPIAICMPSTLRSGENRSVACVPSRSMLPIRSADLRRMRDECGEWAQWFALYTLREIFEVERPF